MDEILNSLKLVTKYPPLGTGGMKQLAIHYFKLQAD